jgi:hypothetical protein
MLLQEADVAKKEKAVTKKATPQKAAGRKPPAKKGTAQKSAAKKAPSKKEKLVKPSPDAVRRVGQNSRLTCIELLDLSSQFFPEMLAATKSTVTQHASITMNLVIDGPPEKAREFEVQCSFGLREIPEDQGNIDDPEPILVVLATYRLGYQVRENSELSEDDLLAFSIISAVRQAWPYWRELVQNTTGRMGQSHILVPLMPPPDGDRIKPIVSKRATS